MDELRELIGLGGDEHDSLYEVRVLDLYPPIQCRPVHLRHAEIRKNQIVGVDAELFERRLPTRDRVHLAESITPHDTDNEITEDHIVVNY